MQLSNFNYHSFAIWDSNNYIQPIRTHLKSYICMWYKENVDIKRKRVRWVSGITFIRYTRCQQIDKSNNFSSATLKQYFKYLDSYGYQPDLCFICRWSESCHHHTINSVIYIKGKRKSESNSVYCWLYTCLYNGMEWTYSSCWYHICA
jgi:hypothetical protein